MVILWNLVHVGRLPCARICFWSRANWLPFHKRTFKESANALADLVLLATTFEVASELCPAFRKHSATYVLKALRRPFFGFVCCCHFTLQDVWHWFILFFEKDEGKQSISFAGPFSSWWYYELASRSVKRTFVEIFNISIAKVGVRIGYGWTYWQQITGQLQYLQVTGRITFRRFRSN